MIQARISRRDPNVIEIVWKARDKTAALDDYARIELAMPVGHREEATDHRRRNGRGTMRSCRIRIRRYDDRSAVYGPEELLDRFKCCFSKYNTNTEGMGERK